MTPERWQVIKEVFSQVLEEDPIQRHETLSKFEEDPELVVEVKKLLGHHGMAGDFLEKPIVEDLEVNAKDVTFQRGDRVGAYELLRKIGQGGMGSVFLARDTRHQGQQVALKIMRPGRKKDRNRIRFQGEQKALSLMDHNSIARIFEASETPEGIPYFAMEYVPGLPVNKYCDHHHLTIRDRIGLVLQVLVGVEHAHQKGIIHRDIKPSNILVTRYKDAPTVKLIDFGIVKATEKLTEETLITYSDVILGTLNYIAPEQAGMVAFEPGPYTDLYAIGILIYELVTGLSPFQAHADAPFMVKLEAIRDQSPKPPSEWFKTSDPLLEKRASLRGASPEVLWQQLRGDLDTIILKLLEKKPKDRYPSVAPLVTDLEYFMREEPIIHTLKEAESASFDSPMKDIFHRVKRFFGKGETPPE